MNLTLDQQDMLTEAINIGVGRAACSLSELVGERVDLSIPNVKICVAAKLTEVVSVPQETLVTVRQDFTGDVCGRASLVFPQASGHTLARLLGAAGDEGDLTDFDVSGILTEVGNIVLNAVMGSIANLAGMRFVYSVPKFLPNDSLARIAAPATSPPNEEPDAVVVAAAHFQVAERGVDGTLVLVFGLGVIEAWFDALSAIDKRP